MLEIKVTPPELFNNSTQEFIYIPPTTLKLEHSLVSVSKWESKWKKPFLSTNQKTEEELKDYIRCMTLTQNVNPDIFNYLSKKNVEQIKEYINDSHTATWFTDDKSGTGKDRTIVTSEVIYAWMVELRIPPEYQKWHLGRLMALIRVCNERSKPPKKMSKNEILQRNRALNEARRKAMNSKG